MGIASNGARGVRSISRSVLGTLSGQAMLGPVDPGTVAQGGGTDLYSTQLVARAIEVSQVDVQLADISFAKVLDLTAGASFILKTKYKKMAV